MKMIIRQILATSLTIVALVMVGPKAQAVTPPPDGGYPNGNTAEGQDALLSLTAGGFNTASGWFSLKQLTTGNLNTAVGAGTLVLSTSDQRNTAIGAGALLRNAGGGQNTAAGSLALLFNTVGNFNTAVGDEALTANIDGMDNAATGVGALVANTTGDGNTAGGRGALARNTGGNNNTALGYQAGFNATTGDGNVYLGADMQGVADEANHTYIRNINTTSVNGAGTDTVTVDLTTGLVGHASSSRRYKHDIKAMEDSSAALYQLKPVTFRYNEGVDHSQSLDYGFIAEEVAQVDPNLAIRDRNGEVENVRYSAINAMLINEFLKEHCKVEQQQNEIEALRQELKTQRALIQKMNDRVELSQPAPSDRE